MVQTLLALLAGSVILDATALPRPPRSLPLRSLEGTILLALLASSIFGIVLAISGNEVASLVLALALVGLFSMVSNAKRAMLGESLLFSDLALIGALFRHPQFYFSALTTGQKAMLAVAVPAVPLLIYWLFRPDPVLHATGLALAVGSGCLLGLLLRIPPWSQLAPEPEHDTDVAQHGLLTSLLLYWARWRKCQNPPLPSPITSTPAPRELAILIQCESFADPVEIFDDLSLQLPGLASARESAWRWGNLLVSGFGAYTMRTEYGVLFGRSEAELGFRRFDPFLTAMGDVSHALPARLSGAGWRSLFVHPHDLRFYNRDRIMAAAGFKDLIGEEHFARPVTREGRYVPDIAIADKIIEMASDAEKATLIYAVTIENHGPWEPGTSEVNLADSYLHLVRKGDAMLQKLIDELAHLKRPATLAFFGDHRPSIPGISVPGGPRHTPYIVIRIDANGNIVRGGRRLDLQPDELHHLLLGLWSGEHEASAGLG